MHGMSVGLFSPALKNLSDYLAKGEAFAVARKFDPGVLVQSRLAPDMLPLSVQIQLASDFAKNSCARLAGIEAPKFEDNEKTMEELQARIRRTREWLATLDAAAFEGTETRDIVIPLRTRTIEMKGLPFLSNWAIPNFYFHATTAYAILRHNGVELGKRDFLGGV